jgi:hypothetical protein
MGNAYNNASLLVTPNGYKASKIYSAKPTDGTGDLAFSRASNATRVNQNGLIEVVSNNIPRLNYPNLGGCPSWLFEPQSTNTITFSEDAASCFTSQVGVTITANNTNSPDGTLNADRITFNTPSSYILRGQVVAAATTYTMSVFVKNNNFTAGEVLIFNMSDGVIGGLTATIDVFAKTATFAAASSGAYTSVSGSVEDYGNGWFRVRITGTSVNGGNGWYEFSNGNSRSCFLWGFSLELGSVSTSYIPTAGSAVTRLLDSVGEQKTFLTGSAGITLFAYAKGVGIAGNTDRLIALGDNNSPANNFISISVNASAKWGFSTFGLGTDVSEYSAIDTTTESKLAFVLTPTKASYFINGVKLGEDIGTFNPALDYISLLALESRGGSFLLKQYNIEKAALSDAEAIELTTL